jgi:hypothetical protein
MTIVRTVGVALIASIILTAMPATTWAGEDVAQTPSVDLRAAIDRAAAQSAMESPNFVSSPAPRPAARARQAGGGGGGASMLVWTLVGTVTSLAATYYIVKEMRKQTDQANQPQ